MCPRDFNFLCLIICKCEFLVPIMCKIFSLFTCPAHVVLSIHLWKHIFVDSSLSFICEYIAWVASILSRRFNYTCLLLALTITASSRICQLFMRKRMHQSKVEIDFNSQISLHADLYIYTQEIIGSF